MESAHNMRKEEDACRLLFRWYRNLTFKVDTWSNMFLRCRHRGNNWRGTITTLYGPRAHKSPKDERRISWHCKRCKSPNCYRVHAGSLLSIGYDHFWWLLTQTRSWHSKPVHPGLLFLLKTLLVPLWIRWNRFQPTPGLILRARLAGPVHYLWSSYGSLSWLCLRMIPMSYEWPDSDAHEFLFPATCFP